MRAWARHHGALLAYSLLALGGVLGLLRIEQERIDRVETTDELVCALVAYHRALLGVVEKRDLPGDARVAAALREVIGEAHVLAPVCPNTPDAPEESP